MRRDCKRKFQWNEAGKKLSFLSKGRLERKRSNGGRLERKRSNKKGGSKGTLVPFIHSRPIRMNNKPCILPGKQGFLRMMDISLFLSSVLRKALLLVHLLEPEIQFFLLPFQSQHFLDLSSFKQMFLRRIFRFIFVSFGTHQRLENKLRRLEKNRSN